MTPLDRLALSLAVLGFSFAPMAEAQTITTRTLDIGSGGTTGQYTSQAIINGSPAISYYNLSEFNLMFARNSSADGSGIWSITTLDSIGNVGQHTSLAVVNGTPAISYYDVTNGDLKYVRALDVNGTNWGTPLTVVSSGDVGLYTSLVVVNGRPAVSYYDQSNGDLKFLRALDANGTSWGTPVTLDSTGQVGPFASMAVVNGNPAISYYDVTNVRLKYVRALDASGTNWGTAVAFSSSGNVGQYTSLAVINGAPAISYYDVTNGDLKYVRALDASGTSWGAPATADSTGNVGGYTSLAVVNGNPAISYYAFTNLLKYVRAQDATGTNWGASVTLGGAGMGEYTSLVVVAGNPAISYYEGSPNSNLKYIRASDAGGTIWPAATIPDTGVQSGDVGPYTSQAIVNGNPAISYQDSTNGDLKYVRALDADGTSWDTPVTVVSSLLVGEYTSLAVVNGNPAICYHEVTFGALKYVRALDASGTSWGTPVVADDNGTGDVGQYTSLAVVNGNPAISYYDGFNFDLKYVRALDASGSSWGTPLTLASTGDVGLFTSLVVVNGNPAISYLEGSPNYDLKYVRALDTSGTSWGTPVTVDSTGIVGQYTSLRVVNGNPAISYYDVTNTALKYVRAGDASGTSWGTSVVLDSAGTVGQYNSLVMVNGNAAISYYDQTNGNLKWVVYGILPDIAVAQASPLTDGAGSVDFGMVNVGSISGALTFTITNPGTANLTNLVSTGATSGFSVSALSSATVAPGGNATFAVTFFPASGGAKSAALKITSNVTGANNPFDIVLAGTGNAVPMLSLPASPVLAEATSASGAAVTFSVTANDAEDGALTPTVNPPSGSTFISGDTTVNVSATDSNGATPTGSFVVRVQDTTAPVMTPPGNMTVHATSPSGVVVNYPAPTASDAVGVASLLSWPASGSLFPNGTTTVTVTAKDAANNTGTATFTVTVTPLTAAESWRYAYFGTAENSGNAAGAADPDGDGLINAMELAFGTHPMNASSGPAALEYTGTFAGGGSVTATGQPQFAREGTDARALFVRRSDYSAVGLTYSVEFSASLFTWAASVDIPTVLADNGTAQIVSVPYPPLVNGEPARFFRVWVTLAP